MKSFPHIKQLGLASCAISLIGGAVVSGTLPAIAQTVLQLRLPDISAPGNRESGSTRSVTCIDPQDNLIALIPKTNYGLTEAAYPTFYFYLPPTEATQMKFVLLNDATNELVYEGRFRLTGDSGIGSIALPENGVQQPLEVGAAYVWYLAVVCDENDPSADVVTEGYVARVAPSVAAATASPAELPSVYAGEGLWYDALAASANLRQENRPGDWNTLLDAVELNELISVPLLTETFSFQEQSAQLGSQ